jgi:hypothetical protein
LSERSARRLYIDILSSGGRRASCPLGERARSPLALANA